MKHEIRNNKAFLGFYLQIHQPCTRRGRDDGVVVVVYDPVDIELDHDVEALLVYFILQVNEVLAREPLVPRRTVSSSQ